jgi:hypothetical protein
MKGTKIFICRIYGLQHCGQLADTAWLKKWPDLAGFLSDSSVLD